MDNTVRVCASTRTATLSRRGVLAAGALGIAAGLGSALRVSAQTFPMMNRTDAEKTMNMTVPDAPATARPTVVLVHGAFADASSWNGVIPLLQAQDVPVIAPANPLRGISIDSAYTASLFSQIPGPVLAVGHSYGGAVISNAANTATNVVGLVFVAAFVPDEGEQLGEVASTSKDAILGPALMPLRYPTGQSSETAMEFTVDPAKIHDAFAADLSADQAAILSATQRPLSERAFSEPNGVPAWKRLPSWAVVATGDKAVGTDLARSMAQRAGATITELAGSHVIMVSQPQAVTAVS
jgi:pimeloyl-ACP methyl ester carboxylesterase